MRNRLEKIQIIGFGIILAEIIITLLLEFGFQVRFAATMMIMVAVNGVYFVVAFIKKHDDETTRQETIRQYLNESAAEAIDLGSIGILMYDDNHNVEWNSELMTEWGLDAVGQSVTMWKPEINKIFTDEEDFVYVQENGREFEVRRTTHGQVLFFKDVTELRQLEEQYENEKVVFGLIHLDNYSETIQYEDETKIAKINTEVRQRVLDWCKSHNMLVRRVRSDQFVVVVNELNFEQCVRSRFDILDEVRKNAEKLEVAITLSMAFAKGTPDYLELDSMVSDMMELAMNRGGDQVCVKEPGEEVKFYGGSTEAQEKRSRVRVRVMAQSIRNMIAKASNVIIVGHKEMDFDCFGAALGMDVISQLCGVPGVIVAKDTTIESKLKQNLYAFSDELMERHLFVNEEEALALLSDDTLVIAVDHHVMSLSNGASILEKSRRNMIIDHHRRKSEDGISASLVYVETSASSATELIVELLQYQPNKSKETLTKLEANIMFAGMAVDTNRFRSRSGSRTFEAASALRQFGADPMEVDEMLKDTYQEFEVRTKILSNVEKVFDDFVIAPVNAIVSRTSLSKAADYLLQVQGIKAAFAIGMIDDHTAAISARSNGDVNVQVIMERMNGGGHLTQAALQRADCTVDDLNNELYDVLEEYVKENEHESNSVK